MWFEKENLLFELWAEKKMMDGFSVSSPGWELLFLLCVEITFSSSSEFYSCLEKLQDFRGEEEKQKKKNKWKEKSFPSCSQILSIVFP